MSNSPLDFDLYEPNLILLLVFLIWFSNFLAKENEKQSNFRRLALRYHPERNACVYLDDEDSGAEADNVDNPFSTAFAVVAEAYDVLSDPVKKAVYDQYGEEGLKKGLVRGPDDKCISPYVFHGQPLKTYREFFGTENPYADLLNNLANPPPLEECPETKQKKKKDEPVIKPLPLTLSEVFYGGIKKMKIQRLVLTGGGDENCDDDDNNKEAASAAGGGNAPPSSTTSEEKILSISIMPGMPSGAKIVFPEEGDRGPTKIPADIIFVTEDKPHETFKRDGANLRMTVKVFLSDALIGTIVTVQTIDDRILRVPITSVISPGYTKTIVGEGLPTVEDPDRRGDLIIDFDIEFPSYLPAKSKNYVQKAFQKQPDLDEDDEAGRQRLNRMLLAGKMYMRADKVSQICRP